MGFEEASRKYSRFVLLIVGSIIAGFLFIAPVFITDDDSIKAIVDSRTEWAIIYIVIINFYFKKKDDEG